MIIQKLIMFLGLLTLVSSAACGFIARSDGPYKGRVIDAESGKPVEGVVILGVWYKEVPSPGGTVGSYFDAQETVTDKNGDFEVKGLGLKILSNVSAMHVLVFKAGYQYIGKGMWASLKLDGGLLGNKVAWEGERAIIPLRKLTMEERKMRLFGKENVPDEKQKMLIAELNKERIQLGLTPYVKGQ